MPRISVNEADHYSSGGNGEWFQLKNDGEVARVQFMIDDFTDIETYAVHKVKIDDKERYVDCKRTYDEPIDNCPFCAAGIPVHPVRFVVMYQHDDQKVKIWERGKQFISKLQGLCNRYKPLSNYVFEIERHGKAGDKETKFETYMMDDVEPFDLSEVDRPEILGNIVLEKTEEEMEEFLDTGNFPSRDERGPSQQAAQPVRRRTPVSQQTPAPHQSAPHSGRSAPAMPQNAPTGLRPQPRGSRRASSQQPPEEEEASSRGASRRRESSKEVF